MAASGGGEIALHFAALVVLAPLVGRYAARVLRGDPVWLRRVLGPVEAAIYRVAGVSAGDSMDWRRYARGAVALGALGFGVVYALQRLQHSLPLNSQALPAVPPDLAFNSAISFVTNTNWQSYCGESALTYLTQAVGLGVQNFVSAATGIAVLAAVIRGIAARGSGQIGNCWADVTRAALYLLLPLSVVLAGILVAQGAVQTASAYVAARPVDASAQTGEQTIPLGPAASQVAIKQLGTNGGGFFGANSAHPFENPTPLTNFLETLAILLLPGAMCFTFGEMVGDRRQGKALFAAMLILYAGPVALAQWAEHQPSPALADLPVSHQPGNMEGKEVRFGVPASALWAVATTAASNGSVNSMHDSLTPLGGLAAMWMMQLGEVAFGGVGCGLYGLLAFAIVAVFVAGLMVGRTPEYLGKKVGTYEMQMATLMVLIPPLVVLLGTTVAVCSAAGRSAVLNSGAHGFSEVLYALSSTANNNGSAFAGLSTNSPFYNILLGLAMLIGRYWLMVPVLAIAGSLAAKEVTPPTAGTLPTHTPLFVAWVVAVVVMVGALSFLPALALGPIAEHLAAIN